MKTKLTLSVGIFAASLFPLFACAEETCDENIAYYEPPAGAYKQISPEEASKLNRFTFADQKDVCVTLKPITPKEIEPIEK